MQAVNFFFVNAL